MITGPDWSARRQVPATAGPSLAHFLEEKKYANVAQWGASEALKAGQARIFETSRVLAERSGAEILDPALPLPLEGASQDLFLVLDFLEYLRMDQLYMVLAEARRTLKPGGICVLRGLSPQPGAFGRLAHSLWGKVRAVRPAWVRGRRPLELTHYISPEDWKTLSDTREPVPWASQQLLILERL